MLDTRLHLNSALIRTSGKGLEILERSDKFSFEHRGESNSKVLSPSFFKIIQGLNSFEVYTVYGRSDIHIFTAFIAHALRIIHRRCKTRTGT